jgi:hypothetical protein
MRFRALIVLLGALLVAATFTFPLWQPLLEASVQDTPEELFAGLPASMQVMFAAFTPEQQAAYQAIAAQDRARGVSMVQAALSPPIDAPADMIALPSMVGASMVAEGEFERLDAIRWGMGDVVMYQEADDSRILFFENFSVANMRDLRVVLSAAEAPITPIDMRFNSADIDLGQLIGTVGNQYYEVPSDFDLTPYNSVVIYSPSLDMIYTFAPITVRM